MSQTERIKRALKLDKGVYREIRDDPKGMAPALTVMVFSTVAGSARTLVGMPWGGIITLISPIILWLIPSSLFYVLAKLTGGRSCYSGYLKATGYAQIPMALNIVPCIGWIIALPWWMLCMIIATMQAHEISRKKALLIVFTPMAIAAILVSAMIASEAINPGCYALFQYRQYPF